MFEDTTIFLLWLATTYVVANIILGVMQGLRATRFVIETQLKNHLNDIIHRVKVEKNGAQYYWFDADDQEFLAQGETDQQIIDSLKIKYPNHIFYLPTDHIISQKTEWRPKPSQFKSVMVDPESSK